MPFTSMRQRSGPPRTCTEMAPEATVSVVVSSWVQGSVVNVTSTGCGCPSMSTYTIFAAFPTGPNTWYVSRLTLNCSGACGPLTVTTGSGSENWCTLYMHT